MSDARVTQLAGELAEALAASRVDYTDSSIDLATRHRAAVEAGDATWQIALAIDAAMSAHPATESVPASAGIDPSLSVGEGIDAFFEASRPTSAAAGPSAPTSVNGYLAVGGEDLGVLIGQEVLAAIETDADRVNARRVEAGLPPVREMATDFSGRFISDRELAATPWPSRNG